MKKYFIFLILTIFMIFGNGCTVTTTPQFEIEQAEKYYCTIGDVLPFSNVTYDVTSNVLKETPLGVFAKQPGEVYIECTQGKYHIIVKEQDITIETQAKQLLYINEETNILASVLPLTKDQTIKFRSYDSSIIKVNNEGNVKALQEGVTTVVVYSEIYNIEKELTFIVISEDEKYYEPIIDIIINNIDIAINGSFDSVLDGIIKTTSSSLVGVSTYIMQRNRILESDFGSGIIYKMNVLYNDGTILSDVKTESEIVNLEEVKTFEYYVITNRHLIYDKYKTKIYLGLNETEIDAKVMQYDDKNDLAVLKFESKIYFPVAKIGDSEAIEKGEFIVSIGNGTGKQYYHSSSFGVISAVKRYINTDTNGDGLNDWDSEYIQHDASINESDSGGAILNLKGEIIGINSTKISSLTFNNMAFAIPINTVMEIVKQLEVGYRPQRATLGVQILDISAYWQSPDIYQEEYPGINIPEHIRYGFYINVVDKGGVADKAKVKVGDIMLEFNHVEIRYSYQVRAELGKFLIGSGQIAEIKVYRNGEIITLYCEF